MSRKMFGVITGEGKVLLALSKWRIWMLLHTYDAQDSSPQPRMIRPQISAVPRLRNPVVGT